MTRSGRIVVSLAIGLLPLGVLAASLDDVTMHVLDANQHAVDVTNNIQIPDQAVRRGDNRNENGYRNTENGENPGSSMGSEDPSQMDQHAIDAIQGTPASGRRGGPK